MIADILLAETDRIGVKLTDNMIREFEVYAEELVKWNHRVNLTAITKPEEIAVKHFIDSLYVAPYVSSEDMMLDIGSGGGLPVLPLKIVRPETFMTSVDAVGKKINFQRHVIRLLGLKRIEAVHARIEELHKTHAGRFSLITSRAFTRLDNFVELAAPLLNGNGRIIAMKGVGAADEISISDRMLRTSGLTITSQFTYELPQKMGSRSLIVIAPCNL